MIKVSKFDVSMFTQYRDMKGNANVEIGVVFGSYGSHNHSLEHIHFLFNFDKIYVSIMYRDVCAML